MNELSPKTKGRPRLKTTKAGENRALEQLAGSINNFSTSALPPGSAPPPAQIPSGAATIKETPIVREPTPQPLVSSPVAAPIQKLFLTGRFLSGKDYVAEKAGYKIFSFAEPLYSLQHFFFGSTDKKLPGAREFLQKAGAYGRGDGPVSIERANFVALIRSLANQLPSDQGVDYEQYGSSPALWLDALLTRVNRYLKTTPDGKVAVTNVRFANELTCLASKGYQHRHAVCAGATWAARLLAVGLTPDSPQCRDISEQLAVALDADTARKIREPGGKLKAIWSDQNVPPPSPRLLTVDEFVASNK